MPAGNIPRLLVAGVASGVGKTTVVVALARALRAKGLRVAPFKCGPDYLDPTYHARAAGAPSHNLDGWMMGREAVLSTFARASQGADIALIEGVMGLYDGAAPDVEDGSAAQIANWLALLAIARTAHRLEVPPAVAPSSRERRCRIALARDAAFHFYYEDNLRRLESLGAELVPFSPIADAELPPDVGGVYLGGGYPELHAEALSANGSLRLLLRAFAGRGGPIYAQGGGAIDLAPPL